MKGIVEMRQSPHGVVGASTESVLADAGSEQWRHAVYVRLPKRCGKKSSLLSFLQELILGGKSSQQKPVV